MGVVSSLRKTCRAVSGWPSRSPRQLGLSDSLVEVAGIKRLARLPEPIEIFHLGLKEIPRLLVRPRGRRGRRWLLSSVHTRPESSCQTKAHLPAHGPARALRHGE